MDNIKEQRERVRHARAEVRSDMRRLTDAVQGRVDHVSNTVHSVREKMNLSRRFRDNFWQTAGVCVGAGLVVSIIFGGRKNILSSGQVKKLSKVLATRVVPQATMLVPAARPLLSSTLLTSLANIVVSMYQAKKTRNEVRTPAYRRYSEHVPLH